MLRFERLAALGRGAGGRRSGRALRILDEALSLWRGAALADIDDVPFAAQEQARLEEERLGAIESTDRRAAGLRPSSGDGCGARVADREHPLRERLWHQRLLALYRSGRQADALRAYRELRSTLVEQLGIEPGPELRELEARILRQDPSLGPAAARAGPR